MKRTRYQAPTNQPFWVFHFSAWLYRDLAWDIEDADLG